VEPRGGERDYSVYFGDLQSDVKYEYHPRTNSIDSFLIPGSINSFLSISPDGKNLFAWGNQQIIKYDLATSSVIQFWPRAGSIVVAPDGNMAAVFDGDFYLIAMRGGTVLYHDTSRFFLGAFSRDSKAFYATRYYQVSQVIRIDLRHGIHSDSLEVDQTLSYAIEADANGDGFFLLSQEMETDVLAHYDWGGHSSDWRQPMLPGEGDIQLSPDGKILYISNPGPLINSGQPSADPPWTITGLDTEQFDTLFEISTITNFDGDTVNRTFAVGPIAITADGEWMFGVCRGRGPMLSINLQTRSVVHAFQFESRYPSDPVAQLNR
jgi:DNA-binding beta-propeller fold protein YncE